MARVSPGAVALCTGALTVLVFVMLGPLVAQDDVQRGDAQQPVRSSAPHGIARTSSLSSQKAPRSQTTAQGRGTAPGKVHLRDLMKPPLERLDTHVMSGRSSFAGEYGWLFKEYISSDLEKDFFEEVRPFEHLFSWEPLVAKFRTRILRLLKQSVGHVSPNVVLTKLDELATECEAYWAGENPNATCLGSTGAELDPTLFSRFIYEFVCLEPPCTADVPAGHVLGEQHTSFIEPLVGLLRHPAFFLSDGRNNKILLDKSYMLTDKWAMNHLYTRWKRSDDRYRATQPPPRSFFIDMGASTYQSGFGGSSQNWFVGLSSCLCAPLTEMFLYESTLQQNSLVYRDIPGHLLPAYHWFNIPLESNPSSWRNPLNQLLARAQPGDAIFVKVDFDSVQPENEIIDIIVQTPALHQYIDELFFEHHIRLGRMLGHWRGNWDRNATVQTSINRFMDMRRRGIRAHSWV